jgi:hypothetical protein
LRYFVESAGGEILACLASQRMRRLPYGIFYGVEGDLAGINGVTLSVTTIWLKRKIDGKFQFITLAPGKGRNHEF